MEGWGFKSGLGYCGKKGLGTVMSGEDDCGRGQLHSGYVFVLTVSRSLLVPPPYWA